jgi:hypothetical protein
MELSKTKMLAEINDFESGSDDKNDGLSRGNSDTSHAKAPDDSNYSERDN